MKDPSQTAVFVSYASEHREVAEDVAAALTVEGYDVFFDKSKLRPGKGYDARIREEIDRCDLLVFLIAPAVFGKKHSYALTELALFERKWASPVGRVLPVMVAPTNRRKIPAYLRRLTPLHPEGDAAAEVAAEVHRLVREDASTPPLPLNPHVAEAQLAAYRALWSLTGRLPKWGQTEALRYEDLDQMSKELRRWYFENQGGLFLSRGAYSHYAELQDAIRFVLAEHSAGVVDKEVYEELRGVGSRLRRFIAAEIGTRR